MECILEYLKSCFSNDPMVNWTAALTIATFLLFFAAVFQEQIKNFFYKPKLNCTISLSPPDCHLLSSHQIYYFRFRIENRGNVSAKNVEVIIKEVKNEKNNELILSQDNLLWSSHLKEAVNSQEPFSLKERMYWDYISPSTYQYCNLGYIKKPTQKEPILKFGLSVYWPSPDGKNILLNGKYSFEIVVGCENGKTNMKKFVLEFSLLPAVWSMNESDFIKKISIEEIKK